LPAPKKASSGILSNSSINLSVSVIPPDKASCIFLFKLSQTLSSNLIFPASSNL